MTKNPTSPSSAELDHLTNVPQAVWIDEHGRIVRPPETAGSTDGFRSMNRATAEMPVDAVAERKRAKELYVAAVKDCGAPFWRQPLLPFAALRRSLYAFICILVLHLG